jgi:hypothetical protein
MSNNHRVRDVFSTVMLAVAEDGIGFVVFGTVAFAVVISLLLLFTRGSESMYDHIGKGGLSRDSDYSGASASPRGPAPDSAAGRAEREREIRQMLSARSERLVRRGQPAIDIDAEVARLLEPAREAATHDAGLAEEVRQLVLARNERRQRQGLEPLDVESETARTLEEMDP